jgi:hypothetical protein
MIGGVWKPIKMYIPPQLKTIGYSGLAGSATPSPNPYYYLQINVNYGVTSGPLWYPGEFVALEFYKDTGGNGIFSKIHDLFIPEGSTSPTGAVHTGYDYDSGAGDQGYVYGYWGNADGYVGADFTSSIIVPGP